MKRISTSEDDGPLTEAEDSQWNHDALVEFPYDETVGRGEYRSQVRGANASTHERIMRSMEENPRVHPRVN